MIAHGDRLVVGTMATVGLGLVAVGLVLPGFVLYPPRLGISSAVFTPLAHLSMKGGWPDVIVFLLAVAPIVALGAYLTRAWTHGHLRRAILYSAPLYALAVVVAALTGLD
jgi:hypothetical protein